MIQPSSIIGASNCVVYLICTTLLASLINVTVPIVPPLVVGVNPPVTVIVAAPPPPPPPPVVMGYIVVPPLPLPPLFVLSQV